MAVGLHKTLANILLGVSDLPRDEGTCEHKCEAVPVGRPLLSGTPAGLVARPSAQASLVSLNLKPYNSHP